jgi:hypothetical protein
VPRRQLVGGALMTVTEDGLVALVLMALIALLVTVVVWITEAR